MKQCETFKSIPATLGWARRDCFSILDRSGQDPCEATGNPIERIMVTRAVHARALPDKLANRELNDPSDVQPTSKQTSVTLMSPKAHSRRRAHHLGEPP